MSEALKQSLLPNLLNRNNARKPFLLFCAACLCFIIIFIWASFSSTQQIFEIDFLNVGQGDSILIKLEHNEQILIDGGPNDKVLTHLGRELPFYDRTVELAILTHPHADHLIGLLSVLKRYTVRLLLMPEIDNPEVVDSAQYKELLRIIEDKDIPVVYALEGQTIDLQSQVSALVRWPADGFSTKDINDYSIYFEIHYGEICALFTGDGGAQVQKQLADKLTECEIFKVPHHGSETALDQEFLSDIRAETAIIEVGKNSYGHPHKKTLDLLKEAGIEVLQTDKEDTIKIQSDGKSYWIVE